MEYTKIRWTQLAGILLLALLLGACWGEDKPQEPIAPEDKLPDTNKLRTEALGTVWHPFVNQEMGFRFNLPRAALSDLVEDDGNIRFLGWMQPDTLAFRIGLVSYLANEPGFLFQIYARPFTSFNKEYIDFEELGADFYRTHSSDKRRPLTNGAFISLQDSMLRAFSFDTEIEFGEGKRTPIFLYPDRLEDNLENSQLRTSARVVYLSYKRYNYRIIYELGNPLAEGIYNSILFF